MSEFNLSRMKKVSFLPVFLSVPLIANLIAVAASFVLNDLIFLKEERERFQLFTAAVPWALGLINFFPFSAAAAGVLFYLYPLIKELRSFSEKGVLSESSAGILLNAPIAVSLIAMAGWFLGTATAVSLQIYYIKNVTFRGMLITISNTISLGGIAMVFTYYTLDYFNRNRYIHRYIRNFQISRIGGVMNLSMILRFFIFFFSVSVLPILILTLMLSRISLAGTGTVAPLLLTVPLVMIMIGAVLSWLLARAFGEPLTEMKWAVGKIQKGEFDTGLKATGADELGLLAEGINEMSSGLREKEFIKETFGRAVDPAVRDHLLSGNIQLGGEIFTATILFCDLRGFTSLSEKLSPAEIVEMLNIHFETMSRCIEEQGGLINKFIGDAIMAIYNVPVPRENHAERAYTSAKLMLSSLDLMNEGFIRKGLPELKIGIGIHTGEVLAGNIGSSSRMEYTVIGDAVNVSSRIESMCKETKRSLLVSEAAKLQLPETLHLDFLGEFQLKGREELIKLYG